MVKQEHSRKQLEFQFMEEWRKEDQTRRRHFEIKDLFALTAEVAIGLTFGSLAGKLMEYTTGTPQSEVFRGITIGWGGFCGGFYYLTNFLASESGRTREYAK